MIKFSHVRFYCTPPENVPVNESTASALYNLPIASCSLCVVNLVPLIIVIRATEFSNGRQIQFFNVAMNLGTADLGI